MRFAADCLRYLVATIWRTAARIRVRHTNRLWLIMKIRVLERPDHILWRTAPAFPDASTQLIPDFRWRSKHLSSNGTELHPGPVVGQLPTAQDPIFVAEEIRVGPFREFQLLKHSAVPQDNPAKA